MPEAGPGVRQQDPGGAGRGARAGAGQSVAGARCGSQKPRCGGALGVFSVCFAVFEPGAMQLTPQKCHGSETPSSVPAGGGGAGTLGPKPRCLGPPLLRDLGVPLGPAAAPSPQPRPGGPRGALAPRSQQGAASPREALGPGGCCPSDGTSRPAAGRCRLPRPPEAARPGGRRHLRPGARPLRLTSCHQKQKGKKKKKVGGNSPAVLAIRSVRHRFQLCRATEIGFGYLMHPMRSPCSLLR